MNFNQLVAPFPHRYREEISAWACRSCRLLRESTALRKYAQVKLEVLSYRRSVTLSRTTLSGVALSAGRPPLLSASGGEDSVTLTAVANQHDPWTDLPEMLTK